MIAIGALSPLKGFMNEADYLSVVKQMRLSNGLPWSVPITLSVTEAVADTLKEGTLVRLDTPAGQFAGILELAEKYRYSKEEEALNVYRTDDLKHPGVQVVDQSGPVNLAGEVWLLERELDVRFPQYQIDPAEIENTVQRKRMENHSRFPNPKSHPPRPRIHPKMRLRNSRRLVPAPASGDD